MAYTDSADQSLGPGTDQSGGPAQAPGGSPPPGGPPPGGGPVLAALTRGSATPPPSAPGMGNQAQGMSQLKMAADMIQQALPNLPIGTPMHTAGLNALRQLTRHLQQAGPLGTQQTQLQDLLRQNVRNQMMAQIMQRQGGGATGMDQQGAGAAPNPSTPLPGA